MMLAALIFAHRARSAVAIANKKAPLGGQKRFAHKKRSTKQPIQSLQRFMYECPVYFGMSGSGAV